MCAAWRPRYPDADLERRLSVQTCVGNPLTLLISSFRQLGPDVEQEFVEADLQHSVDGVASMMRGISEFAARMIFADPNITIGCGDDIVGDYLAIEAANVLVFRLLTTRESTL